MDSGFKKQSKSERRQAKQQATHEKFIATKEHEVAKLTAIPQARIPSSLTYNESLKDPTEDTAKFEVRFTELMDDKCDFSTVNSANALALINKFKHVNATERNQAGKISRGKVENSGKYISLYRQLNPDVTLWECEFSGEGRIFYHYVGKYISIVGIRTKHINID